MLNCNLSVVLELLVVKKMIIVLVFFIDKFTCTQWVFGPMISRKEVLSFLSNVGKKTAPTTHSKMLTCRCNSANPLLVVFKRYRRSVVCFHGLYGLGFNMSKL